MANVLKVNLQETIVSLAAGGWSKRRIARELQIDRKTIRRYLRKQESSKSPTISTAGSEDPGTQNPPFSTPGSSDEEKSGVAREERPDQPGRPSLCDPYTELIQAKADNGLTGQRIYQDLVSEAGFEGSYQAVKRFIRRYKKSHAQRVWRLEVHPAEEAQIDFGTAAPILTPEGTRKRPWILRIVLSYSRKGYSECVLRQTTENFIRCLENGFRVLGGVTKTLNIDNLKAAVSRADWYDPEAHPKLESFCRHYGTVIIPCRAKHAEHKGRVERGVGYVKSNALAGRTFASLAEQNAFLSHWERTVADLRIHGTTRKQVAALFAEEKPALLPLPPDLFPCFEEGKRIVHRDSYVEVDKAFYEVPPEYIGQIVWVRWDRRLVRVFNQRWGQIKVHAKLEPGRFTRPLGVGGGHGTLEQNLAYWLKRAGELGGPCAQWASGLAAQRGFTAIRPLIGLVHLSQTYSFKALNQACAGALSRGLWRLKDVRRQLEQSAIQTQLAFTDQHPLIRNLAEYGLFIEQSNAK